MAIYCTNYFHDKACLNLNIMFLLFLLSHFKEWVISIQKVTISIYLVPQIIPELHQASWLAFSALEFSRCMKHILVTRLLYLQGKLSTRFQKE